MPELHDNVSRVKRFNFLGTTIFVGLRAADVWLQRALLEKGWASKLVEKAGGQPVRLVDPITAQIQPYFNVISLMALGSSLKQILTMLIVSEQDTPPASAFLIALFNTIFNSLNTLFFGWNVTSQSPVAILRSPPMLLGISIYAVGISAEMTSELQRTIFKRNPNNKGKPYSGGLFSLARHINYGAYTLWRASYAYTSAGWPWGLLTGSFFFHDFATRGVPVLDRYLTDRYGDRWAAIKSRVPYRLLPYIY
ncbi:hypothetical protein NW756_004809 [Fusarium oxysporum]|nr:hypothetical protein NW763_011349 [Fusarium oxysporum]KAJ4065534.1 hypothetical protein NW753_003967 [Fusarium oxysporum]KAJ4095989.1 hypothetical protein NW756_004809 [Fusarium oxysporum]